MGGQGGALHPPPPMITAVAIIVGLLRTSCVLPEGCGRRQISERAGPGGGRGLVVVMRGGVGWGGGGGGGGGGVAHGPNKGGVWDCVRARARRGAE
jgi:hypothetical protein